MNGKIYYSDRVLTTMPLNDRYRSIAFEDPPRVPYKTRPFNRAFLWRLQMALKMVLEWTWTINERLGARTDTGNDENVASQISFGFKFSLIGQ